MGRWEGEPATLLPNPSWHGFSRTSPRPARFPHPGSGAVLLAAPRFANFGSFTPFASRKRQEDDGVQEARQQWLASSTAGRSNHGGVRCLPARADRRRESRGGGGPRDQPRRLSAPSFPGRFLSLASGTERGHWPDGKASGGVGGGSAAAPRARGRAELAVPAPPGRTEVQRGLPDSPACFPLPPPSPHPSPPLWRSPPSSGRHLPESRFCFGAAFSLAARRVCERRGRQAGGAARPPLARPRRAERRTDGQTASRAICSPELTLQTPNC